MINRLLITVTQPLKPRRLGRPSAISKIDAGVRPSGLEMTGAPPATVGKARQPRRQNWPIIGLMALFLGLVTTYAVLIPPFEGFDALAHYGYITYLRTHRQLPLLDRPTARLSYELVAQPPLYYTLAALASLGAPLDESVALAAQSANPYHDKVLSQRLTVTLPERTWASLWPVWIARGVAMAGGLLAVLGAWLLTRTLFPRAPTLAIATTSMVGFNPQFLFAAANITTDAWSVATNVFTMWAAARSVYGVKTTRSWFWVGVCAGLAALAKYSAFLLGAPLLVFGLIYLHQTSWRQTWRALGFALVGFLVVAGGYYARNLWYWGQPIPMRQMALAVPTLYRPHPFSIAKTLEFVPWLIASYWGVFVSLIAPAAYLDTTKAFMWVGALGLPLWLVRKRTIADRSELLILAIMLLWFVLFALSVLNWTRTIDYGEQGRLMLAASPALALLLVFGWQAWLPSRWQPGLHMGLALFFVGLALSQTSTLYNGYHLPATLAAPPQPQRPINATFESGMQLLGIDLPTGAAIRPGQPLPLTLYFSTPHVIDGFYTLFIHLADDQDRLLYQFDGVPAQGRHPTRQWLPGGVFADTYSIVVKDQQVDGLATLSLGFYQYDDKTKRQAVLNNQGQITGDRVVLAPVRVHANSPARELDPKPVARWTNGIQLATAEVERNPANLPVAIHVKWQATQIVNTDYTVFVQLLDKTGKLLAQVDQPPQQNRFPTSTWQPGDVIEDDYHFAPLPTLAPDAQWAQLIIGLYDQGQTRLSLQASGDNTADFFVLLRQDAAP
ncbi:MAG: glycosyltransferase family 39 protein [Chloroflexi bacterium]|nr:glycosyltransferase family 39 protein [Chloroflexota bacterium]